jgi:fructose-bisphosphate aldolase, class I
MRVTQRVRRILDNYESDNPGTKTSLARILMAGRLGGTGKLVILPVDQGFEHGPARSFAPNADAYDPHYLFKLAIDAGLNAYAAPLGALEAGADSYAGSVPLILKMNSANTLPAGVQDQAVTGGIDDALRLGCSAVGFTIYPGVDATYDMYEEVREMIAEAKSVGLAAVVWAYPRGNMSKDGETAIDVVSYSAHMACLLGAHVIKVKLPTDHLEQPDAKKVYEKQKIAVGTQAERVAHVVQCCFAGRRIVVFSGGAAKGADAVFQDARDILAGGGNGSIIGRNSFQRSYDDARALLDKLVQIYLGKA